MKLTVYIDVLIAVNFVINYMLLKISAFRAAVPYRTFNVVVSAIAGAVFSLIVLFDIPPWVSACIKIISVTGCCGIAFGFVSKKYFIRTLISLLLVTFAFTGIVSLFSDCSFVYLNNYFYYININPLLLVGCITAMYMIVIRKETLLSVKRKGEIQQCTVTAGGCTAVVPAFFDTGFNVKDILGHRAVILCSLGAVNDCMEKEFVYKIRAFLQGNIGDFTGIIHVFYSDITGDGILPAIRPEKVLLGNSELKNTIIAFTDKEFHNNVGMIYGKDIFDMIGD